MDFLARTRANIAGALVLLLLRAAFGFIAVPLALWRFTLLVSSGVGGGLGLITRRRSAILRSKPKSVL